MNRQKDLNIDLHQHDLNTCGQTLKHVTLNFFQEHHPKAFILLAVTTLAFTVMPITAEIYQWTDKDGNVHFSDKPSNKIDSSKAQLNQANNINFNQQKNAEWLQKYNQKKALKEKKQVEQKEIKKKRKAMCDYWQSNLNIYQQVGRISTMSAKGERSYLTDEEISQQRSKLKKDIAKHCR